MQIDSNVNSSYHSAIKSAANTWNNASGSSFYFYNNSTASTNKTVVQMGSMPDATWEGYEQIRTASGNYKRITDVYLDSSRNWSTNSSVTLWTRDVETVTVHELGHAAGLAHSTNFLAVMYYKSPSYLTRRSLINDDINGIKARYPSSKSILIPDIGMNSNNHIQLPINPSIVSMTEEEMTNHADFIVSGTVKQILSAQWDTPDGSDPSVRTKDEYSTNGYLLYYDTLIEIDEIYKGNLESNEVYVRTPGGSTNSVTMINDASASYQVDEKVILYLFKDNGTRSQSLGPVHYFAYPRQGQLFVKSNNQIIDGYGEAVDFQNSLLLITELNIK